MSKDGGGGIIYSVSRRAIFLIDSKVELHSVICVFFKGMFLPSAVLQVLICYFLENKNPKSITAKIISHQMAFIILG